MNASTIVVESDLTKMLWLKNSPSSIEELNVLKINFNIS